MKKTFLFWGALFWALTLPATALDYIQQFSDYGEVNWTRGEILATGSGRRSGDNWTGQAKVDAHRAATVDAMRRLVEIMHGIHVDSQTVVAEFATKNDTIRTHIEGIARNFTEKDTRFSESGICEVDLMVPLTGEGTLSDLFLNRASLTDPQNFKPDPSPVTVTQAAQTGTTDSQAETAPVPDSDAASETAESAETTMLASKDQSTDAPSPDSSEPVKTVTGTTDAEPEPATETISGLVINASGKPIRPALCPSIITDSGESVYGFDQTNRDFRKLNGLASYAADIHDARLDRRVTENPYVMEALDVREGHPCIIIVSEAEAKKFQQRQGSQRALNHCRVIIVTQPDQEAGKVTV